MKRLMVIFCCFVLFVVSCFFVLPVSAEESEESVETELIPGAVSGVLMEANTGKIVFQKEADKEVAVASMTREVHKFILVLVRKLVFVIL